MEQRTCSLCGALFQPVRVRQETCSVTCYRKRRSRMLTERKRSARQRDCTICGTSFDGIRGAQTCSAACYIKLPEVRERRLANLRHFYAMQGVESRRRRRNVGTYGLGEAEYEHLLASQGGRCAICGERRDPKGIGSQARLHIDHCHTTGRVRGLLCGRCNPGLGYFKDDENLLMAAVRYLKENSCSSGTPVGTKATP